jgi:hypothetical protein
VKGTIRSTATANVSLKIGSGVDQLCIGIFESSPTFWFVQRRPLREDIADRGIDCAGQETVGFLEAGHDLRGDAADERKGAWGFRTFQLAPTPGDEAYVLVAREVGPDGHSSER